MSTQEFDWDLPNPHVTTIQIAKSDIDGMGHANNACYVVWCERCAWSHSQSLGLTVADYQRLDRGVAIHKAYYEYCLPAFENEELRIGTWLTACDGKLRLERRFQMVNVSTGQTVQRGHWQLICVTLSSGRCNQSCLEFVYAASAIESLTSQAQELTLRNGQFFDKFQK